jgi:hypothetical protein
VTRSGGPVREEWKYEKLELHFELPEASSRQEETRGEEDNGKGVRGNKEWLGGE